MSFCRPHGDAGSDSPRRHLGLLIGIDAYPDLHIDAQLRGAINDVHGLADTLEQRFAFDHRNLILLTNSEATRSGILSALDERVEQSEPGDVLLIHFSGHGSQVWDAEGDEPDGLDETWIPYDGHREDDRPRKDLIDDELLARTSALRAKGVYLTLIMDCCHSGHAHRSGISARQIPPDLRRFPVDPGSKDRRTVTYAHGGSWRGSPATIPGSQITYAACRDDQLAFETGGRGVEGEPETAFGAWTWALIQTLRDLTAPATAGEVFARAAAFLTSRDPRQWPQMVGDRDRLFLDTRVLRPKRHVQVLGWAGEELRLDAGAAAGLREGSRWGLYTADVRDPEGVEPAAEAVLTRVDPLTCHAELRKGRLPSKSIASDWRAFEQEPAAGERRLKIRLELDDPGLTAVIEASPALTLVSDSTFDVRIHPEGVDDEKGRPLAGARDLLLKAEPHLRCRSLEQRLEKRARFLHGLKLRQEKSDRSALSGCLKLCLLRSEDGDSDRPELPSGQSLPRFYEGDLLQIHLEQGAERSLYVYLLDFGLRDDVSLIYPGEGGADLLEPEQPLRLGVLEGDRMELFLPDGYPHAEGLGFIKVFLTTRPTDFSWICTDRPWPSKARRSHALEALLSMGRQTSTWRKDEDWTTELYPFELLRRPEDMNRGGFIYDP